MTLNFAVLYLISTCCLEEKTFLDHHPGFIWEHTYLFHYLEFDFEDASYVHMLR